MDSFNFFGIFSDPLDMRLGALPPYRHAVAAVLPEAPVINVWYGDNQTFGQNGIPQIWVNILGNVSSRSRVASITYSPNGGPEWPLSIGPNRTRLVDPGDFNAEIAYLRLIPGANTVCFTATARNGSTSKRLSWPMI